MSGRLDRHVMPPIEELPGTPPMGVLSDYLAFFWGYAVAIVALGILTITWLRRLPPKSVLEDKEKV